MATPSIQDQLRQVQLEMQNLPSPTGPYGPQYEQHQARLLQLQNKQQQLAQQQQAQVNTTAAANDPVQKAKDEMYGLARGAVTTKNPIDQQILAMLQERTGADAGPFNTSTRNALMTQASDAASQAMLNAKGRINGSAGDPSVMAANNEADARRSQAIQQAQLGINSQANVANYDARGQALGQLGGYNQAVQHNQTDNERYLMHLLSQESQYQPDGQQSGGIPTFQQFSQSAPQTTRQTSTPWGGFTAQGSAPDNSGYVAPRSVAPAPAPVATAAPAQQPAATTTRTVAPTTATAALQPQPRYVAPRLLADPYGY